MKTFAICLLTSTLVLAHPGKLSTRQLGFDYEPIIADFRARAGLTALYVDPAMEANAAKTLTICDPGELCHQLNPGTMAQVLATRNPDTPFAQTYEQSWLCERPEPYLNCPNPDPSPSTGHADILNDIRYSHIGCAQNEGTIACDLTIRDT